MINRAIDRLFIKHPKLRRRVTRLIYGSKDRKIKLLGLDLTINSVRENGYLRAERKSRGSSFLQHEVSILITLATLLDRADTFVDAGANIGVFSCFLARRRLFDPRFKVVAFEPHPDTFQRLKINAGPLGVEAHNIALSDKGGMLEFVDGAVSHVFTLQEKANAYSIRSEVTRVAARRLDDFALQERSILLKIDVEGQELRVLQGALGLFNSGAVKAVYIDGYYDDAGVVDFLNNHGFELFDLETMQRSERPNFSLLAVRQAQEKTVTAVAEIDASSG